MPKKSGIIQYVFHCHSLKAVLSHISDIIKNGTVHQRKEGIAITKGRYDHLPHKTTHERHLEEQFTVQEAKSSLNRQTSLRAFHAYVID